MTVVVWLGPKVDHVLLALFPGVTINMTAVPNPSHHKILKNVHRIKKFLEFSHRVYVSEAQCFPA
jgi:hypothetical protein